MGPLWLDVAGYELSAEDREILQHPTVGGVILFGRNYHDNQQLLALNKAIRQAAKRPILIGVDQEGGRVQRFREGFSRIPPAQYYARAENGVELAEQGGWLMAAELIAHDVDLSFAPVLDMGFACKAIGNRAFGEDVQTVLKHSSAFLRGMKAVGMATTGKHFPGFKGIVFSDDLSMEGAAVMGGPVERSHQALVAGCDMILMCNKREAAVEVLDNLPIMEVPQAEALLKKQQFSYSELKRLERWQQASANMQRLIEQFSE
ncbi:beta-N-acetylhexosaminidase [Vibrio cholerae]|uniref:beta-N-acetylhexosaminidase n=1 Tax=Vibrio cholerae TaxID=666 RepID=UPI000E0D8445|nr:beta-N-acetylhexosaminidase [Vibrio cholerae]